jgi:hypothetical protein
LQKELNLPRKSAVPYLQDARIWYIVNMKEAICLTAEERRGQGEVLEVRICHSREASGAEKIIQKGKLSGGYCSEPKLEDRFNFIRENITDTQIGTDAVRKKGWEGIG